MKRIGVFTSGRDAPGTNAILRAIGRTSFEHDYEVIAFRNGMEGVVENDSFMMDRSYVSGILPIGGTILGTSLSDPYLENHNAIKEMKKIQEKLSITCFIGVGSFTTMKLCSFMKASEIPVIGIPATIDNNIPGTDYSVGFQTAVNYVSGSLDRLHSTASSHHRVFLVEVMGGQCGWIALYGGLTGGADLIIIPEKAYSIQEVVSHIRKREGEGKFFSIVVLADTAGFPNDISEQEKQQINDHNGLLQFLSLEIVKETGMETRQLILGHLQRGGSPLATDRLLGTLLGNASVECIRRGITGVLVGQINGHIEYTDLELIKAKRPVDLQLLNIARIFY
ncbi:MAG: ATP-dependent 6-phosphofructokinase [Caldisericia bacterium]|nr:ATP-dependent 6-phosphofructokinase [Caldisericia bacterium]